MAKVKKFKLYSKLNVNVIDHPKIRFGRLKKKKWLRLKKTEKKPSSDYGLILLKKQLLRGFYGNLCERQFKSFYIKSKLLKGNTGLNFIKSLESRIDTVLFRLRFGNSFEEVRQLITHKHICVNDKIVSSSSFLLKSQDRISVKESSFQYVADNLKKGLKSSLNIKLDNQVIEKQNINNILLTNTLLFTPNYLEMNYNILQGIFLYSPNLEEIRYPFTPDLSLIMQYYEHTLKV